MAIGGDLMAKGVGGHMASPPRAGRHARASGAHVRLRPTSRRDRRRLPLAARIAIVCALLIAAGAGGYFAWRQLEGAKEGHAQIDAAIEAMGKSDDSVLALNDAVGGTTGDGTLSVDDLEGIAADAMAGLSNLDDVCARLDAARGFDQFLDDDDRGAIDALQSSADARRDLVTQGNEVLALRVSALRANESLDSAIDKAVEADGLVGKSVDAASAYAASISGGESDVTDASVPVDYDKQAASALKEATSLLSEAKEACPSADLSAYEAYLKQRTAAVAKLTEADQAIAAKDYEKAASLVKEYNKADAKASELAKALPDDASTIFSTAIESDLSSALAAYDQAFATVSSADQVIRGYQGVNASSGEST